MNAEQAHLIRKSFALVEPQASVAALVFYKRLFELAPQVRPLFTTDIEVQSRKLMDMIGLAVNMLNRPTELTRALEHLGARHIDYQAKPEHYAVVGQALLDMLSTVVGKDFTPETRQAWTDLYHFMSAAMLRGAVAATENLNNSKVA